VNGINSLPQIAADIAIIRADLRALTGPLPIDENWQGIPAYLFQYITGPFDAPSAGNAALYKQIDSLRNLINRQTAYNVGTTGPLSFNQAPLLLTASQVTAANMLLVRQELERLNSSIGNASTSTPNFTALAWLALIANSTERSADCCEEGSAPPPPANNPPPTGFCVPANAVRQVSWNAIGTQLVNGVVNNVFRPVFDFSNGVNAPLAGTGAAGAEPTAPALRFSANIDITFCISWDFAGNTPPTAFGRYFGINQATTEGNQDLAGPLNAPSTLTVGGLSDDRNTCDGIERYGAHNFAFPVGITPSLNVFLGLTQSRGCAQ